MRGVLIKDKEAGTVVSAVYNYWILGLNGLCFGTPSKHVYSDFRGLYEFYQGWFKVDLLIIKKKGEMLILNPQVCLLRCQTNMEWFLCMICRQKCLFSHVHHYLETIY